MFLTRSTNRAIVPLLWSDPRKEGAWRGIEDAESPEQEPYRLAARIEGQGEGRDFSAGGEQNPEAIQRALNRFLGVFPEKHYVGSPWLTVATKCHCI